MTAAVNMAMAISPDTSSASALNALNTQGVTKIDTSNSLVSVAINQIDNVTKGYDFLQQVTSPTHGALSAQESLEAQNKLAQFNLSTQLVGKSASIIIKDVDALTRLQ